MSNNTPAVFQFNNHSIRTIEKDGEVWFIAKDVAETLGYSNVSDAIMRHCKGVAKHDIPTTSGIQSMNIIPERDVYRLIMKSTLPSAEKFEEWVVAEVLPSIRKTGSYGVTIPTDPIIMLRMEQLEQQKQIEDLRHDVAKLSIISRENAILRDNNCKQTFGIIVNPITARIHAEGLTAKRWAASRGLSYSQVRNVIAGLCSHKYITSALIEDGFLDAETLPVKYSKNVKLKDMIGGTL